MLLQLDLANPTLEFLENDPSIAERFGATDSISYLMHNIADFLGVSENLITMPLMFFFNLLVSWLLIYCVYYRFSRRRDYYVQFMLFSSGMFVLLWLMQILDIQTGFVLGLFAIFGMIRYRTETIKIREMTYLFVVMGLSIVNGMALSTSYAELVMVNLLTVLVIWLLDGTKILRHTATKIILYDRIENTKHGKEEDLKADLIERTGLDISKVEVGHIDYLRDVAFVKVYYKPIDGEVNTIDTVTKLKDFDV